MVERAFNEFHSKLTRAKHELVTLDALKSNIYNEIAKLKKELDACYQEKVKVLKTHHQSSSKCSAHKEFLQSFEIDFIADQVEVQELKQMRRKLQAIVHSNSQLDNEMLDNDLKGLGLELKKRSLQKEEAQNFGTVMHKEILRLTKSQRDLDTQNCQLRMELINKQEEMADLRTDLGSMRSSLNLTFKPIC